MVGVSDWVGRDLGQVHDTDFLRPAIDRGSSRDHDYQTDPSNSNGTHTRASRGRRKNWSHQYSPSC